MLNAKNMKKLFDQLPKPRGGLIGHRGVAGQAPENTRASFEKAHQLGLNWVEFDIRCLASGEWVVFHDETLERTTNGTGLIAETPLPILQTLDAGSWFHPKFKDERIPLLSQTLQWLADFNIHPNIEIKLFKASFKTKKKQMADLLNLIQCYWPSTHPLPLVSSFDRGLLEILRQLHPTLPLGYLIDDFSESHLKEVSQLQFHSLHCADTFKDLSVLQQAVQFGIPILIYTVNNLERIEKLKQQGASGIFSDLTKIDLPWHLS